MNIHKALQELENECFLPVFKKLYGTWETDLKHQKKRYAEAIKCFAECYPGRENVQIFSAPGRTEIGGNHTDHQHGCVLAGAVNLDVIAVVSLHNEGVIRVKSKGYEPFIVLLDDLSVKKDEKGSSAIVRGMAAGFGERGVNIGGFDMYTTSDVLSGSGISSSAAFETLIGTVIDSCYHQNRTGAAEIAKIGQYAENVYFGKGSGLMDQMVCSVGGLVSIDFHNTENPDIKRISCDFESFGYCLCITDTKGSHADLTEDYAAVCSEMEHVAAQFGKGYLRDADESEFYENIPKLRESCSDRAILRAAHFFAENRRAKQEAAALADENMEYFLGLVRQSGESSEFLLQNLYSSSKPAHQEIPLGIMMSKRFLGNKGAVRVHGGGFAGTIQAFVPLEMAEDYCCEMNRIFGADSCYVLRIRPAGGIEITKEVN